MGGMPPEEFEAWQDRIGEDVATAHFKAAARRFLCRASLQRVFLDLVFPVILAAVACWRVVAEVW